MAEPLGGFDTKRTYDSGAEAYEDASRDFWQHVARRSVERLDLQPGERVLDVPCGTGPSLVLAARAVGPGGRVTGVDYAPGMVAMARERASASGFDTIEVRQGDMLALAPPAVPFDAVVCALGVFFVDDMPAAVRSLLALVRPGTGRLLVSVFGEAFCEPLRTIFVDAVGEVAPGVDVIEPWRRAEREATVQGLFEDADVADIRVETDRDRLVLRPSDWWRIVMGSGFRHTIQLIGEAAASEVRARCDASIAAHGITELTTTSRYATARRGRLALAFVPVTVTGRVLITIDCTDPAPLAEFWAAVLGGEVRFSTATAVGVRTDAVWLAAMHVPDYRPPAWPSGDVPKQMHLDVEVTDLEAAVAEVERLGATPASHQPAPALRRIMLDPAGHPFCLTTQVPRDAQPV